MEPVFTVYHLGCFHVISFLWQIAYCWDTHCFLGYDIQLVLPWMMAVPKMLWGKLSGVERTA